MGSRNPKRSQNLTRRIFLGGLAAVSSGLAAGWLVSLFDFDAEDDRPMPNALLKKLRIRPQPGGGGTPVDPGTFSATHTLGVGRLTMGQATPKGQVPAGQSLAFSGLATQCDIKTTWDDGSARFAILSADVASGGAYPLGVGSSATGTFSPTIPTASVTLTISGTAYTATLPASVSSDPWLSGPVVREWRHKVTPITSGSTAHPFLRVYFDVRAYAAGGSRLDVTVENTLDHASAAAVTYDVVVNVNGSSVFTATAQPHYYLTRWRKVFGVSLTESAVGIDWTPAQSAGAVPKFLASSDSPTYTITGSNFVPMGRGNNAYDFMGSTGGRSEIAPYPDWAAAYMAHGTANQRATSIINSDLAGSWPVHIRNADDSLISIDARPDFWLDSRGSDKPAGDMATGKGPLQEDMAHVPSFSYVPYLFTGDRFHMEEMAFWGGWSLTGTWDASSATNDLFEFGARNKSTGYVGVGQTRGRAWGLRNLTDAAAYLPHGHPSRAEFRSKVANNLSFFDSYAAGHTNAIGSACEIEDVVTNDSSVARSSIWQQAYLGWSIHHAKKQGFSTTLALRDKLAAFQLKLFTSGTDYPREYAGPYYLKIGVRSGNSVAVHSTMSAVFNATYVNGGATDPPVSFVGNYGFEARMHLLVAVALGLPGASDALTYLMGVSGMTAYVNGHPGFAIDPSDYP